jgi:hypothetical protein
MKMNNKMTKGKLDHILSWASVVKAHCVWTKLDRDLEKFLKGCLKKIARINYELHLKKKK